MPVSFALQFATWSLLAVIVMIAATAIAPGLAPFVVLAITTFLPAVVVSGMVYARGASRAFFVGAAASGLPPFLYTYVFAAGGWKWMFGETSGDADPIVFVTLMGVGTILAGAIGGTTAALLSVRLSAREH